MSSTPPFRERRARRVLSGLTLLFIVIPAVAARTPPPAVPGSAMVRLSPDDDFEVCTPLSGGQAWHYRFDSDAELGFSAHYHRDNDARSLWRKDELRHEDGALNASFAAVYCVHWHNYQESPLRLHYTVDAPH